jgi:flagellar basal body rod protein FlgG
MISAVYPALSALRAFGEKLGIISNNIANINTTGFKRSRALLEEAPTSGVSVAIHRVDNPGSPLLPMKDTGELVESSNVAVEEEMVDLIATGNAYTANLKTIKTEEETLGTLFDILDK